jgi:hypothetical protein
VQGDAAIMGTQICSETMVLERLKTIEMPVVTSHVVQFFRSACAHRMCRAFDDEAKC